MNEPHYIAPPKLPLRFLRWFCSADLIEDLEGDLAELFHERHESNPKKAKWLYLWDVMLLFRPGIIKNFSPYQNSNNNDMIRNYIKTAFRHFMRYKGYTAINVLGLTVGITCSLLIFLWVNDEISKDKFHAKEETLYKIYRNMYQDTGEIQTTETVPQPFSSLLKDEYSEVDQVIITSRPIEFLFQKEDVAFRETGLYVSPEFLQTLSFPLITGNNDNVLEDISSIVISREMAEKHFGSAQEAMGQTLRINDRKDFIVSGVLDNISDESSMEFEWLINAEEFISRNDWVENWENGAFTLIVSLSPQANIHDFNAKIEQEINNNTDNNADERLFTQKLSDGYLYSNFENGVIAGGRIEYVRILTIVAIFVLLIACINFMNLTTVRSTRRAQEIGVRKVVGAHKHGLRVQFFVESFLLTIIAVFASLILAFLLLPFFNTLTGKNMFIDFTDPVFLTLIGGTTFVVGFLSGSYPALLLPSFNIIKSLKGTLKHSASAGIFRKGLVIFQFALSIILIIGALTVGRQIDYILNKNLGMDKSNMVTLELEGATAERFETFREQLLNIPQISKVSASSGNPLSYGRSTSSAEWKGKNPDANIEMNIMLTAHGFIPTMGMELIKGRDFSTNYLQDSATFIINEVAANLMGFENPVGEELTVWGIKGKIIGNVKDFHMSSLYDPIEPLILTYFPQYVSQAFIRIDGDTQQALEAIEGISKSFNPSYPFVYQFLDEEFAKEYKSEQMVSVIVNIFAFLAIFVSCLGLLGLSSYLAQTRTREIGIRKVFGANIFKIVFLLAKDYTVLILIALVIALPLSYYVANNWLDNFVFRMDLGVDLFIWAGLSTIVVAMLTIGFKAFQAAFLNPVNVLKDNG